MRSGKARTTARPVRRPTVCSSRSRLETLTRFFIDRIHSIFDFSLYMLRRRGSTGWRRPRPINPGLVPLGQFRNDALFYFLGVTARVDRIGRNTQPVGADLARGGAAMVPRNEHYLIFTSIEVVPDDEMMSITFQRGTCFRNKQRGVGLELITYQQVRGKRYQIYWTLNDTINPSGVHSSTSGFKILGT